MHAPEDIIAILQFVDAKKFCIFKVAYRDTKIKVEKRKKETTPSRRYGSRYMDRNGQMTAPFSGVLIGLCNNNWFNTVNSLNIVYNFYPTGGRTCGAGMVLLYDTEAGLMGRRVDVEFIFSEFEWQVIQALDIDIVEICRKSIKNEIRDRAETREFIYKQQNTVIENENLLNELERLRKQLPTVDDHAFWATIKKPTIKKPPIKKSSIKK